MVRIKTSKGTFDYEKSTRKDKKLMVNINGVIVHFGNPQYEQYKDKTGIWSHLDHNDKKRRDSYLKRSGGIIDGSSDLTKDKITSSNYHSREVLW